jgi:hypothetical protein
MTIQNSEIPKANHLFPLSEFQERLLNSEKLLPGEMISFAIILPFCYEYSVSLTVM